MRMAQIMILSLLLTIACTAMDATNPTSRPTYTPYPTFTPESPLATTSNAEISTRLADPGEFVELEGRKERFSGAALSYVEEGIKEFKRWELPARNRELQGISTAKRRTVIYLGELDRARIPGAGTICGSNRASTRQASRSKITLLGALTEELPISLTDGASQLCQIQRPRLLWNRKAVTGFHTDAEANYILASCSCLRWAVPTGPAARGGGVEYFRGAGLRKGNDNGEGGVGGTNKSGIASGSG